MLLSKKFQAGLPPHSSEAERGVLGAILLSPVANMGECVEKFTCGSEVFYDLRRQTIFDVLVEMYNSKNHIDLITLQQRLKDKKQLEAIGGFAYLASLPDCAGTGGHLGSYAQIVWEKYLLRKMILTCSDIVARAYDHDGDLDQFLDEAEINVLRIRDGSASESKSAKSLVDESIAKLEILFNSRGEITGFPTGLKDLDKKTDGIHPGEMIVIAALPSLGKSSLAMNILVHNALLGVPVGFYSAEMRPVQLMLRSICSEGRVNLYDVRDGVATQADFTNLTCASGKLAKAPIHIENASGWSIGKLQASARRMKQQYGIKIMAVDYIQLLNANADNREQEISAISKGLKSIGMELDIPVLVLSQVTDDGRLRESRAIGQDADGIWKLELDGDWQPQIQPVKLKIEKNKEGPTGLINLIFHKTITRFELASKIDQKDYEKSKPHKND